MPLVQRCCWAQPPCTPLERQHRTLSYRTISSSRLAVRSASTTRAAATPHCRLTAAWPESGAMEMPSTARRISWGRREWWLRRNQASQLCCCAVDCFFRRFGEPGRLKPEPRISSVTLAEKTCTFVFVHPKRTQKMTQDLDH